MAVRIAAWCLRSDLQANATYLPHLWICGELDGSHAISFRFTDAVAGPKLVCAASCGWRRVADLRARSGDPASFDAGLLREFTLVVPHPELAYPTLTAVWKNFQNTINVWEGLVFSDQVFPQFLRKGLETFRDDGIQHVELRQVLQGEIGCVYTLNGTVLPPRFTFETIGTGSFIFFLSRLSLAVGIRGHPWASGGVLGAVCACGVSVVDHTLIGVRDGGVGGNVTSPGRVAAEVAADTAATAAHTSTAGAPRPFTGARAISCGLRGFPVAEVESALALTKSLMPELPDVIVGFDLVGQEDPGRYGRG